MSNRIPLKRLIVCEVLLKNNGFMTQVDLYNECCKREEFLNISRHFRDMFVLLKPQYDKDFDVLIRRMEEDDLVKRAVNCFHKQVVVLTLEGKYFYNSYTGSNKVKALLRRRLNQKLVLLAHHCYYDHPEKAQKSYRDVVTTFKLLEAAKINAKRELIGAIAKQWYDKRKYGDTQKLESCVWPVYREIFEQFGYDFDEILEKGKQIGERRLEKLIGLERVIQTREVYGNCIICGAEITHKEAQQDAELLKKFTGAETGMVCCSCYYHLKWLEEHFEKIV